MRIRVMVAILAVLAGTTLTACSGAENECAAPSVSLSPTPVVAGTDVTVVLAGVYDGCNDQGEGPNQPKDNASIRLVPFQETATVAEVEVPIGDAAGGTATLSLATVAPGKYWLWIDDIQSEVIQVQAP